MRSPTTPRPLCWSRATRLHTTTAGSPRCAREQTWARTLRWCHMRLPGHLYTHTFCGRWMLLTLAFAPKECLGNSSHNAAPGNNYMDDLKMTCMTLKNYMDDTMPPRSASETSRVLWPTLAPQSTLTLALPTTTTTGATHTVALACWRLRLATTQRCGCTCGTHVCAWPYTRGL